MKKAKDYDRALWYEIFIHGEYSVLDPLIQTATRIFDIGGYKGYFTYYCLRQNSSLEVHFFEPVEKFYQEAKNMLGQHSSIIRNNAGIWKRSCFKEFFVNPTKEMQSSFYQSYLNPFGVSSFFYFTSLSQYCKRHGIKTVDVCKIDVEGAEWEILLSWSKRLANIFKTLFVEYHILFPERESNLGNVFSYLGKWYDICIFPHKYDKRLGYLLCVGKDCCK